VNFMQYSRGSSADYDEWARIVGDDSWKWENTKERFKRVNITMIEVSVEQS
jgi:choline dehydrogenase-like flavoprotein